MQLLECAATCCIVSSKGENNVEVSKMRKRIRQTKSGPLLCQTSEHRWIYCCAGWRNTAKAYGDPYHSQKRIAWSSRTYFMVHANILERQEYYPFCRIKESSGDISRRRSNSCICRWTLRVQCKQRNDPSTIRQTASDRTNWEDRKMVLWKAFKSDD